MSSTPVLEAWVPQQFLHELYFQPHPGASYRADHCGHQAAPFWCEFPLFLPCCERVPPPVLCSQSFCSAATKTPFLCGHVPKKQNLIDTEEKHSNGKKTPPAPEIRKRFNVPIVLLSIITFSLPPLLCNP